MNRFFLFGLLMLVGFRGFPQTIASTVYSWSQASAVSYPDHTERTLLNGVTRDFANLNVRGITLLANQPSQPSQTLDEETLLIIREGELTVTLGGKTRTLGPNSIVLVMPGDLHRFENKSTRPVLYYEIRYTSNEMPDLDLDRMAGESFWIDWNDVPFQPHDKGGIRRMFDRATVMTKRFEMHVTTLRPGLLSHPPHTHRAAEMLILVDSSAQIIIGGALHPAGAGDLVFLESDVAHGLHNTGSAPCTYFAFQFE
ncbi:cupin domain-containing protein [Spirosoma koreense]